MTMTTTFNTPTIPSESELKSYHFIAKTAAANPHWQKLGGNGSEEQKVNTIFSVMLLARELGISPMIAVSGGINNIQGKFEISARIMNMLIRRQGHKLNVKAMNNQYCTIWGKRRDTHEEMEVTYHIEEANRSGLVKAGSAWQKIPQDMLFARAISRLARRLYPDTIGGCYVEGELQETILGAKVETIEVPPMSDVNCEVKVESPFLILPNHINKEMAGKFLEESATKSNVTVDSLIKRANENMDGFVKVYDIWLQKQKKEEIPMDKEETLGSNEELEDKYEILMEQSVHN